MEGTREEFVEPEIVKQEEKLAAVTGQIASGDIVVDGAPD
jgi:hypothetical protein